MRSIIHVLLLCSLVILFCDSSDETPSWNHCLPGEQWTEDCHFCICDKEGHIQCELKQEPCYKSDCYYPSTWYSRNEHCHCASTQGGNICVPLIFQNGMNEQHCPIEGAQFYNDCMLCICAGGVTRCKQLPCGRLIGVCTPGESTLQSCHKCSCTITRFHVCVPIPNCQQEKAGKCPNPGPVNIKMNIWCNTNVLQTCRYDMECPGNKKCCLFNSCYNYCTNPLQQQDTPFLKLKTEIP